MPNSIPEILDHIEKLVAEAGKFRTFMAPFWPTPPFDDCIYFAHSETGEVSDAVMRLNPIYVRNNVRTPSVNGEKGDVALMLLSALWVWGEWRPVAVEQFMGEVEFYDPDRADVFVAEAKYAVKKGVGRRAALRGAVDALVCICCDPDFDIDKELAIKIRQLKQKHYDRQAMQPKEKQHGTTD